MPFSIPLRISRRSAHARQRALAGTLSLIAGVFLEVPLVTAASSLPAPSPDGVWSEVDESSLHPGLVGRDIIPKRYRTVHLDTTVFSNLIRRAPLELTEAAKRSALELSLPMPDGGFASFRIEESPIMEPGLARQFPDVHTYRGQGIDDPTATARFDWTSSGFHAIVLSPAGTTLIDPYRRGDTGTYICYDKKDYERVASLPPFHCLVEDDPAFRAGHSGASTSSVDSTNSSHDLEKTLVGSANDRGDPIDREGPIAAKRGWHLGPSGPDFTPHQASDLAEASGGTHGSGSFRTEASNGTILRTYRLALAANGEYTQFQGGTKALAFNNGLVPAMNRVNAVYERELAIRMVMVANEMDIIFEQPLADPYVNEDGTTMLFQNQAVLTALIGSANYDIGHVFSTGGGGVAGLGVVCDDSAKAEGVTGLPAPTGDAFWIDFVAHEMGHEFGGNHTFNGTSGNCSGNRNAPTAWEPGSGSTIMPYAGICAADDLQPHSDDYFHTGSFGEFLDYAINGAGNACSVRTPTGNLPPVVDGGPSFIIPAQTPFALTATGSDPDGDPITYCWEEFDVGAQAPPNDDLDAIRPILRSFSPTMSPTRTFPRLSDILSATSTFGESLPTRSRTMQFRVTARDNRSSGGGVSYDQTSVTVSATSGPFRVTSPQTPVTWTTGSTRTVTWDVSGTTGPPVSASLVNIRLSTDGGQTFPIMLESESPNDGSQLVTVPGVSTTTARVKVEGAGNIFFDISDVDFTITPASPRILTDITELESENCGTGNGSIDPGETVTVSFSLKNVGTANGTNLVATLLPTGGTTLPSGPRSYGPISMGGPAVARPFTFRADGACGGALVATLSLTDDGANLGTVDFVLPLGVETATSRTFSSTLATTIPPQGPAVPYPSSVTVSGVVGSVSKVTVSLQGLTHPYPDDLDLLLVGPGGQNVLLMSDVGGGGPLAGVTLTFDDSGPALPVESQIAAGSYRPTDEGTADNLTLPAPQRPYGSALSAFNGLDPNGTWSLYIVDDAAPDNGDLAQWSMTISTRDVSCCGFLGNPKEASAAGDMTALRGAGTLVTAAYTPACGASDHAAFSGVSPISGALEWTAAVCGLGASGMASFDLQDPPAGELRYFVIVGQNTVKEGSFGRSSSGVERPEASVVGACDRLQDLSGSCP